MEHAVFEQKHYQMAKLARFFSFLAIISALLQTALLPFILGGLAITFAVLSKGDTQDYSISAKIAFILGIIAIVMNVFFMSVTIYKLQTDPVYVTQLNTICRQLYGMSWNEMTSNMKELWLQ